MGSCSCGHIEQSRLDHIDECSDARACVRACVRARACACVRACVRACVFMCVEMLGVWLDSKAPTLLFLPAVEGGRIKQEVRTAGNSPGGPAGPVIGRRGGRQIKSCASGSPLGHPCREMGEEGEGEGEKESERETDTEAYTNLHQHYLCCHASQTHTHTHTPLLYRL